jgi:hypothetical protein
MLPHMRGANDEKSCAGHCYNYCFQLSAVSDLSADSALFVYKAVR